MSWQRSNTSPLNNPFTTINVLIDFWCVCFYITCSVCITSGSMICYAQYAKLLSFFHFKPNFNRNMAKHAKKWLFTSTVNTFNYFHPPPPLPVDKVVAPLRSYSGSPTVYNRCLTFWQQCTFVKKTFVYKLIFILLLKHV